MFDFSLIYERLKNPYVIAGICLVVFAGIVAILSKYIAEKFFKEKEKTANYAIKGICIFILLISLIIIIVGIN